MREFGQLHLRFWGHKDIEGLNDQAKLLAIYMIEGPHSNSLGCYRLPVGYIHEDLGWSLRKVSRHVEKLREINFIRYDEKRAWLFLPTFLKWNPIANPNMATGVQKLFNAVPQDFKHFQELAGVLLEHGKHFENGFLNHLTTVLERFGNNDTDMDTDTDKDKKIDAPEPSKDVPDLHPSKRLKLNYRTGKLEGLLAKDRDYLEKQFPACNLDWEVKEFESYWYARPKQRKSNWWKTLTNRLAVVQEKGGTKRETGAYQPGFDPIDKRLREEERRLRGGGSKTPQKDT